MALQEQLNQRDQDNTLLAKKCALLMRDNSRLAQEAVLDTNSGRAAILALKNTLASQIID